ncbi:hypothetical protein ACLB2K_062455 [Fragaria x ananassa]
MDSEIDECLKQLRTLAKNSVTKVAADNNVRSSTNNTDRHSRILGGARTENSSKRATAFGDAYLSLRCTESPGTVGLSDIWELVRALTWEDMYDNANCQGISTEMSLLLGAKRFLEWRHSKYMMGRISEYPVLAALGGEVVNMQQIRAFLRVHLKDYGVLDFDASDVSNPPPVDTTWQQVFSS